MDGVSEEDNEIYLEVCPDSLTRSLKSAQNAKTVKIKLTKRHTSCITFEIELVRIYLISTNMTEESLISLDLLTK
jgi:HUS1 checkpoint protein